MELNKSIDYAVRLTDTLQREMESFTRRLLCNKTHVQTQTTLDTQDMKSITSYQQKHLTKLKKHSMRINNNKNNKRMCHYLIRNDKSPSSSNTRSSPNNLDRSSLLAWTLIAATLCALVVSGANAEESSVAKQVAPASAPVASIASPQSTGESSSATARTATQASIDRQVSSPQATSNQNSAASPTPSKSNPIESKSSVPAKLKSSSQKPAKSHAAQHQNYDKYQLKASPFSHHQNAAHAASEAAASKAGSSQAGSSEASGSLSSSSSQSSSSDAKQGADSNKSSSSHLQAESSASSQKSKPSTSSSISNKQAKPAPNQSSSFSLLRRILPSFMTSATAAAAMAAVANNNNGNGPNSRSSPGSENSANLIGAQQPMLVGKLSNKLIDYLTSQSKRSSSSLVGSILPADKPAERSQANLFTLLRNSVARPASGIQVASSINDRQAGPAAASGIASLLSNPLGLGLLFSAPLIPSLLLTPLALAGLSPAMSAINNLFGDDDDDAPGASGKPGSGQTPGPLMNSPLASLLSSPSSPLSTFLQNTGIGTASGDASSEQSSSSRPGGSFALQAMQSFLGPTSTTERPLFKPGMFASSSNNVQNAISSALSPGAGSSSTSTSSSGSSSPSGSGSLAAAGSSPVGSIVSPSGSPIRSFFGGGGSGGGSLMQAAASMISPSFAASSSAVGSQAAEAGADEDKSLLQMASDVFEKVSNFMDTDKSGVAQASGSNNVAGSPLASPISTLVGLSNFSPFQLSSLLSSTPFGSALAPSASHSSSSSSHHLASAAAGASSIKNQQRAGFFGTLKNIYELFSSSFMKRQETSGGSLDASNECQQRLICELHQKAMNSKLFRRSVQSNLMELAQLDRSLQEQMRLNPSFMQARVDPDTKAILNDFLKASNGFKQGRELVSCSKMFPKCSRTMLFSFANTHLGGPSGLMSVASMGDSTGSKAIGKFSNLMKKMKFKSIQQHQQQWKLRKPGKANAIQRPVVVAQPQQQPIVAISQQQQSQQVPIIPPQFINTQPQQMQASSLVPELSAQDYLQVAPLVPSSTNLNQQAQAGQLNPVDSLKLAQQILMYQQQQHQQQPKSILMDPQQQQFPMQPQQQQHQQYQQDMSQPIYSTNFQSSNNNFPQSPVQMQPQQQQPMQQNYQQQASQVNKQQVIYTDSIGQQAQPQQQQQLNQQQQPQQATFMYTTDSPYYNINNQQQQQSQFDMMQAQQPIKQSAPSMAQQVATPTAMPTSNGQQYSTRSGLSSPASSSSSAMQMTTPVMAPTKQIAAVAA